MKTYLNNHSALVLKGSPCRSWTRAFFLIVPLLVLAFASRHANAGVYITPTLDGNLSEWSSVPDSFTQSEDNNGYQTSTPDITSVQLGNDSNYFYLAITFADPVNLQFTNGGNSLFLAFDTDSNTSTGFNVYGANQVGSELGYQNDFPFAQSSGNFNSGVVDNGGGLISPYDSSSVTTMEIGIPLNSTYDSGGAPTFPNQSFNVALYIDGLDGDNFTGAIPYTLAVAPEANSLALLGIGVVVAAGSRYLPRRMRRS